MDNEPTTESDGTPPPSPWDNPTTATPPPSGEGATASRLSNRNKIIIAAAGVVLIGGASFGVFEATKSSSPSNAAAANGPGGQFANRGIRGGTTGTVKSINGSTLVVSVAGGADTTVNTSSNTEFTKTSSGAFSDLKAGDHVTVQSGSTSAASSGTVTANQITDSGTLATSTFGGGGAPPNGAARRSATGSNTGGAPPNGAGGVPPSGNGNGGAPNGGGMGNGGYGRPVVGTIDSVSGTNIVVTETDGTKVTVDTSSTTTYQTVVESSLSAITVGETVTVQGSTGSDNVITATSVREGSVRTGTGTGTGTGNTTSGGNTTGV